MCEQARKPRNYASPKLRPSVSLTGVKCRATSVAKNIQVGRRIKFIKLIQPRSEQKYSLWSKLYIVQDRDISILKDKKEKSLKEKFLQEGWKVNSLNWAWLAGEKSLRKWVYLFSKEQHRGNLSLQKLNRGNPILLKVKIFQNFRKFMKFLASVNYIHYMICNLMRWSIYNILSNCLSHGYIYSNGV